jgi:hypothetical protein
MGVDAMNARTALFVIFYFAGGLLGRIVRVSAEPLTYEQMAGLLPALDTNKAIYLGVSVTDAAEVVEKFGQSIASVAAG